LHESYSISTFVTGPLETNTYVLISGKAVWIVDPGMGVQEVIDFLQRRNLVPTRIALTHGHGDHIAGVVELTEAFGDVPLVCPATDAFMLEDPRENLSGEFGFDVVCPAADELVKVGQKLTDDTLNLLVLDTSGHTPGGVSYYWAAAKAVLTGDALFAGSIGRTDFAGGDLAGLLENIRRNLLTLPDGTQVLPGHGPKSSIAVERRTNPFLLSGI